MKFGDFAKIKSLQTTTGFKENLQRLGLPMPCDDIVASGPESPLGSPLQAGPFTIGNRFAIQPMEGWDCHEDGRPSDNTIRRWRNFGLSGAKFIWGGEAVAVRHDGRANPNQLMMTADSQSSIAQLRETLVTAHREAMGDDNGLVIGLQLTHSGRFCKPNSKTRMEPLILYRHPILDRKFKVAPDHPLLTDGDIRELIGDYVIAAKRARECGYQFVDLKHCHGYLGHEFLSRQDAPGRLRRLARESHALPARAGGGHPRRSARAGNRRARVGDGPRAVQARSRAVGTRLARSRRAGRLRAMPALSLRLRHRRARSGPDRRDGDARVPRDRAETSASSSSTSRSAARTTTRTSRGPRSIRRRTATSRRRIR